MARRGHAPSWWRTALSILSLTVFGIAMRGLVAVPVASPSEAMLPSIQVGDYPLVTRWSYGWSGHVLPGWPALWPGRLDPTPPRRGDVVMFRVPPDARADHVLRVVGLAGDRVGLDHGRVVLNGRPLPLTRLADFLMPVVANSECTSVNHGARESQIDDRRLLRHCRYARYRETMPDGASYEIVDQADMAQDDMAELTVPAGRLFLLGDNRDVAADSRFPARAGGGGVGLVPLDNLEGRAVVTVLSFDGTATPAKPWTWVSGFRSGRIGGRYGTPGQTIIDRTPPIR